MKLHQTYKSETSWYCVVADIYILYEFGYLSNNFLKISLYSQLQTLEICTTF